MRTCSLLPCIITIILSFLFVPVRGQVVPESVTNIPIYLFLDELAADGIIDLNSAVKPYSREGIRQLLESAKMSDLPLAGRQTKEIDFYLAEYGRHGIDGKVNVVFNPATARYHDSLFSITVTPLLGFSAGKTTGFEDPLIRWNNGARVYGSYGKWGFFAALQDNHQDPLAGDPVYLTRESGGHIKNGTDFSDMTGGISYAWRRADLSFVKDVPVWGSGYGGTNILSGRAPSFMQVRLHIKPVRWMEMTWFHGWLNSMVVDSSRSYWVTNAYGTDYREVYHTKFMSANILTFTPLKRLHISLGNSVIYSDARLMPVYLLPFFFYKSVDHAYNSGIDNSNSQMFIDISSYQLRHLHLYGTLFIDELSTARFFNSDYNFFSWKGGFRAGNFGFLPGLWLTGECTFTYPLTYQHYVPVLTFEHQGYNLGHYLRDNTRNFRAAVDYKPVRGLSLQAWYEYAERGPDYQSIGGSRLHLPYISEVVWRYNAAGVGVQYIITGGVAVTASFIRSNITGEELWTAPYQYGSTTGFNGGVVWGF